MTHTTEAPNSVISWATEQFQGAVCSDIRRRDRLIRFACAMAETYGKSIPQLCNGDYDTRAVYNLLDHDQSTPDYLQTGHRRLVHEKLHEPGTYLLIEDDSTFSWTGKQAIEGLGPSGDFKDGKQGFNAHSVLAVKWPAQSTATVRRPNVEVLGLADQQFYLRGRAPTDLRHRKRSTSHAPRKRESDYWFSSLRRIGRKNSVDCKWIRVCDRAADIYELFNESLAANYDFVIRAVQDRGLVSEGSGEKGRLFETARRAPELGEFKLRLRTRKGQAARTARLRMSARSIELRSPQRGARYVGQLPSVKCHIIHVCEIPGPQTSECERIEWFLLVSQPVSTLEAARTAVQQYASRWIIEDFHKAIKSGCGAERLQLKHGKKLIAAVAIMSIVASRIIQLREVSRLDPDAGPEKSGLSKFELDILAKYTSRTLRTVYEVALALGRLGGHLNRKNDGPPGLVTLTRGLEKLCTLCEGAQLLKFGDQSFG